MSNWVKGLRQFLLAAIICGAALALPSAAHAQNFAVTNVTKNTASKASFPSMVTDSQGNLNAAWIDSANGLQFARSSSSASGTSFGIPPAITTIKGPLNTTVFPSFQPQVAVYPTQENVVEITWASPDVTSTPAAPLYDIWAARSSDGGANFATTTTMIGGPVALFDGPRLAFDGTGKTDIVWGRNNVWISQAQDGLTSFTAPIPLMPLNTPIDTGGPRIAVTAASHIFVVWTDELAKDNAQPGDKNFCTDKTTDVNGKVTNTFGGNVWINETLPNIDPTVPVIISSANTRNLSKTDWTLPNTNPEFSLDLGFYGCSYDNMNLFLDKVGLLHLLWSDDSPGEDVLTSETHGTYAAPSPFAGLTEFSFPGNLASLSAASPQVAVDKNGIFYFTWSGGPTGGSNSEGIFYIRSDDAGSSFTSCTPGQPLCAAINIAPKGSVSPAFPQIAVDSNSNVNIAWEQPTAALKGDGTDMFNVFFARSTDQQTFPTVLQVTTNPSTLCYEAPPPPQGDGTAPTTPDVSTCGTVQLGVDASSNPGMVWVNQTTSTAAVADIDFATPPPPAFSIALAASSASVLAGGTATFNVQITSVNGFNQAVTLSCGSLPAGATCLFNPATTTSTSTLTVSTAASAAVGSSQFTVMGTSGSTKDSKPATLVVGTITASVSPASATIAVLSSADFTLNLSSPNGFKGTVSLDCPGLPAGITCTFNPASISVSGVTTSTTLKVAISAKPTGSVILNSPRDLDGLGLQRNTFWGMAFVALALILSGMIAASRRETPLPLARGLAVMTLVLVLAVGLISCSGGKTNTSSSGGGGGGAANPFTGQITVRAQSGGGATNVSTMSVTVP
jgi:hypothetical protein